MAQLSIVFEGHQVGTVVGSSEAKLDAYLVIILEKGGEILSHPHFIRKSENNKLKFIVKFIIEKLH